MVQNIERISQGAIIEKNDCDCLGYCFQGPPMRNASTRRKLEVDYYITMFSCWLDAKVLVDTDELMSLHGHSVSLSSAASQHRRDIADTRCFSSVQVHTPSSAGSHPVDS